MLALVLQRDEFGKINRFSTCRQTLGYVVELVAEKLDVKHGNSREIGMRQSADYTRAGSRA
jgi:hypothetical protein